MSHCVVVVLSAARRASGACNGGPAEIETAALAGTVMKDARQRSGAAPELVHDVTAANAIARAARFADTARVLGSPAGLPMAGMVMSVKRPCSSGWPGIAAVIGRL